MEVRQLEPGEELQVGDTATLRFTDQSGKGRTTVVTGEVVGLGAKAVYLAAFPGSPFSIYGLQSATRPVAPKVEQAHGPCVPLATAEQTEAEALRLRNELSTAKFDLAERTAQRDRLVQDVAALRRPIDRAHLARELFIARMVAHGLRPDWASQVWDDQAPPYRAEWMVVADKAISQIQAP